jgi:oligosaccharide repeat unit polymerase
MNPVMLLALSWVASLLFYLIGPFEYSSEIVVSDFLVILYLGLIALGYKFSAIIFRFSKLRSKKLSGPFTKYYPFPAVWFLYLSLFASALFAASIAPKIQFFGLREFIYSVRQNSIDFGWFTFLPNFAVTFFFLYLSLGKQAVPNSKLIVTSAALLIALNSLLLGSKSHIIWLLIFSFSLVSIGMSIRRLLIFSVFCLLLPVSLLIVIVFVLRDANELRISELFDILALYFGGGVGGFRVLFSTEQYFLEHLLSAKQKSLVFWSQLDRLSFGSLQLRDLNLNLNLPFVSLGNCSTCRTNVFTAVFQIYFDFGFAGFVLFSFFFGSIFGLSFRITRQTNSGVLWRLTYGLCCVTAVLSIFHDAFFLLLPVFIRAVLILFLFWVLAELVGPRRERKSISV